MKLSKFILSSLLLIPLFLAGCNQTQQEKNNLVILYTNDVHCNIDGNIGYDGLKAYKDELIAAGDEVILVDAGDNLNGGAAGAFSKGDNIIKIMNEVGYNYVTPGNHDFFFGTDRLRNTIAAAAKHKYISCNLMDLKTNTTVFDPYSIYKGKDYSVGFVGICTPETIRSGTPSNFQDENGNYIYGFCEDETGEKIFKEVQKSIDALKEQKVDYIVALGHVGSSSAFSSQTLIQNISGLDAFVDGHSHEKYETTRIKDKSGNYVLLTQTGTELATIGKIVINKKGNISTGLISSYEKKDATVTAVIKEVKASYEKQLSEKIGHTNYDLVITDPATSKRMVRNRETNLANLISDAYKWYLGGDVGMNNAGAIRKDIPAGDLTYGSIYYASPFGNQMISIKAKGSQILDFLENGASETPNEGGGFCQPSGLNYTIDTSITSSVKRNTDGSFKSVDGEYRVKDVTINGEALDKDKYYVLSGTVYSLRDQLDASVIFKGAEVVKSDSIIEHEVIIKYIKEKLNGEIPSTYSNPYGEGRITIK